MKSMQRQIGLLVMSSMILAFSVAGFGELVGYWAFQNSSNIGEDSSGLSNNLTTVGNASYANDPTRGGVLQLDGNGDYLEASTFPTGVPTGLNANYTIALWYKFEGGSIAAGGNYFVGWGKAYTSAQVNGLGLWPVNAFKNVWLGSGNDFVANVSSATAWISDGDWYHVAVTYDGTTRSMYLNGELVATNLLSGDNAQAQNFTIGHNKIGTSMSDFNGLMDDVIIYNEALTHDQVVYVMNNGPIPEPATMSIVMSGSLLVLFRRRRNK